MNARGQYGNNVRKIAPIYAGQQVQVQPRFAARTRAVKAVFDMYTHARTPFYIYAEVNGMIDKRSSSSIDEANAIFGALERAPGEVYAAIFDPTDPLWPGPAFDVYHGAPQVPQERPIVGAKLFHTIGDREQALRALHTALHITYQELTQQILHVTPEHPYGLASDTSIRTDWLTWWKYRAVPFFTEFSTWAAARSPENWSRGGGYIAYGEHFKTDWAAYKQWRDRLVGLRREAEEIGIRFRLPLASELNEIIGASIGITLYHSVGDRADAVKTMSIDWTALYISLASQVGAAMDPTGGSTTSAVQKAREEELAAIKVVESFQPLLNEVYRIEKLLNQAGLRPKITRPWLNKSVPPYADITSYDVREEVSAAQVKNAEQLKQQFIAAKTALDNFMPMAQQHAAVRRANELSARRGEVVLQSFDPKKVAWWKSYAAPLFAQWNKFKSEQLGGDRTVAADYIAFAERWETNWDVYEDWRKKLDKLRAEAVARGFTVDAPKPMDLPTTVWADAGSVVKKGACDIASGIGDAWKLAKYGLWGVLGIGAVVALSSVVSNLRSGKDPAEKYMELIKDRKRSAKAAAARALPAPARLALSSGDA